MANGSMTANADVNGEYHAPKGFSAEGRTKLEAMYDEAKSEQLPREPIARRVNEGRAKGAAEGAYLALPGDQGTEFATYAKKYAAFTKGKESDAAGATFGAEAYDAATILIKAIEKIGKDEGGKLTIDQKALQAEILKTDLAGASGQVKFGADGNRAGAVVKFFQVVGGKYVQLKAGEK